jgi:hypothetical protein
MSWQSYHYRKFVAAIIVFLGLIYLLTLNPLLGTMGDNAKYIILAKSIVSGNGFRNLNFPGAPRETKYGFGYPVLIAPVVYFFPDNVIALKLVTVFFAILALLAVFQLFKGYTDLPGAIAVMALSGGSSYFDEFFLKGSYDPERGTITLSLCSEGSFLEQGTTAARFHIFRDTVGRKTGCLLYLS